MNKRDKKHPKSNSKISLNMKEVDLDKTKKVTREEIPEVEVIQKKSVVEENENFFFVKKEVESDKPRNSFPKFAFGARKDETERVENKNPIELFNSEVFRGRGEENINSFSSIFKKDHEEILGIKRVFRKSVTFMLLSLFSFGALVFLSINFYLFNPVLLIAAGLGFVIFSNIFYIIAADKSYVLLNILGQILILVFMHLLIGQGFSVVTLFTTFICAAFSYFSYAELEKNQLGSRLFSIGQVTNESTKALTLLVIFVLTLGVYNSIVSNGAEKVVTKSVLDNPTIFNKFVIGEKGNDNNLNHFFNLSYKETTAVAPITLGKFLEEHYRNGNKVVEDGERDGLKKACAATKGEENCVNYELDAKNVRLEEWKKIAYPNVNYALDTPLDEAKFRSISRQFYINYLCVTEKGNECEYNKNPASGTAMTSNSKDISQLTNSISKDLNPIATKAVSSFSVPRDKLVPIMAGVVVFTLLYLVRPLIGWVIFALNWVFWAILRIFGYVKIDVETVEAEVVSI
jgi:hypothetical protein